MGAWALKMYSFYCVTRILARLMTLAAAGLMRVIGSETSLHLFRGENESTIITAILFMLVIVVATMRWKLTPIARQKRA